MSKIGNFWRDVGTIVSEGAKNRVKSSKAKSLRKTARAMRGNAGGTFNDSGTAAGNIANSQSMFDNGVGYTTQPNKLGKKWHR